MQSSHEAEPPVAVENDADEHPMPGVNNDEDEDSHEPGVTTMRLGRMHLPYDYEKYFPETAHFQQKSEEASEKWINPIFCDEDDWSRKLGHGRHYRDTYFTENLAAEEVHQVESDVEIKCWDDEDQHALCQEVLGWMGCHGSGIDEFCFKAE